MPKTRRKLTNDPARFAHAQGIILRWLRNSLGGVLSETKAVRVIQQEFGDTKAEIQKILRSDDILRDHASLIRRASSNGTVSFRLLQPKFSSLKSATNFIKNLRITHGYSNNATSEWRRWSMKLSNCGLIQFARRLAARLEGETGFLVGVDEQDFNPKIYILAGNRCCVLSVTRQPDERTYTLECIDEPQSDHSVNISQPPTDEDLEYACTLVDAMSLEIIEKIG